MKHLFTALLMLLLPAMVKAQSIGPAELNTAGMTVINGGNIYEYTIGSAVCLPTQISGTLVVTHGVLQPTTDEPTGVNETTIPSDALSVYPNPVDQVLFLKPSFGQKGKLQFALIDAQGRTIKSQAAELKNGNELQQVSMSAFAIGQYTLQVQWNQQGKTLSTSYKIQKIK